MASEETRRESQKCLDNAEKAFKSGDIEKAMRLVHKAIRMNPNDRATSLLAAIEAGETRVANSSQRRNCKNGAYSSGNNTTNTEINKNEAENSLKLAENAFHTGNLEKAKRLATKSNRMYPSPRAEELLRQIQSSSTNQNTRRDPQGDNYSSSYHYNHTPSTHQANANLDDALQSIEAAEMFLKKGNLNKAEIFANKAQSIHQTTRGKDLLRQIAAAKEKNPNGGGSDRKPTEGPRVERKPRVVVPPTAEPSADELRRKRFEYTEEQLEAIRRVKAAKDDYDILGVPKKSKVSIVQKAFRKIAKLLHPDQNKSTDASDTFIKVTAAKERIEKTENKGRQRN